MNAIEITVMNELIIETHWLIRELFRSHYDDAIGYYDKLSEPILL